MEKGLGWSQPLQAEDSKGRYNLDEATGRSRRHLQKHVRGRGSDWASGLLSPWLGRKGREGGWGSLFGIDDVHEFGLEGSTTHKEAIHVRLAGQLLAGYPGHRASISDTGALSHRIRDVGLKPFLELLVYFLGLLG